MCLATPSKVIKIEDDWATVESRDHTHRVSLSLLKNVKLGDYLLVHDELAINKIPPIEAKKILEMIKNHSH
ncbi:HypC/HybG/HupF family hydrogenase formation chaperone [Patescibacteria group bacterium]|nr:HypC/HybG/HupF family hydrogenase formation chaperone [Patescibacteria group bacterium]